MSERDHLGRGRLEALRSRARVIRSLRAYFHDAEFLEVETPAMVPSPGLDLHLDAYAVTDAERFLITSPEYQMKRLVVGGAGNIVQFCRCFRRNEVGDHHEPEFLMLEWYRLGSAAEVRADTERLVARAALELNGTTQIHVGEQEIELAPPWDVVSVRELLAQYAPEIDERDDDQFFRAWVEKIEPQLGRPRPVFVTEWPAAMASLARLNPDDPSVADRFEAYVAGIELCNGFDELTDAEEQRARLGRDQRARERTGKAAYPIDERFLAALEEGLPRCSGNALGVDRLVMLLTGAERITDIVAIPSAWL